MARWYAVCGSRYRDSLRDDVGELRSLFVPITLHDSPVGDALYGGFHLPAIGSAFEPR
jgi:hypothetical protein